MDYTVSEVLQFVNENDVKFIRLAFCDILGIQKNISIMPTELENAFENGKSFDASSISGFMNVENSDLFLYPDPGTLTILPWRPQQGRVARFFCDIKHPSRENFEGDARNALKTTLLRAEEMGYTCNIGSECEFYLFECDDLGRPTYIPYDEGSYLDIAPLDRCENVRRDICLTLEQMGIIPESSHHEQGPGQNEIDFKFSDALTAADNLITFKSVVKTIAARNGLYASFMPKPFDDKSGNGLHINLSLSKNGLNIFKNNENELSKIAESFLAGILDKAIEITAILNPTVNSYKRLGCYEAPKYVSWSHQNRSQLIRIPAETGECTRMELRSPDPACNPYLAFALIINAGLDGIEKSLKLNPPTDFNLYNASKEELKEIKSLPENLEEALNIFSQSEFVKKTIPNAIIDKFTQIKLKEWHNYINSTDKNNIDNTFYFKII